MRLNEWVQELQVNEKGYVKQCFKFWNGKNGNHNPLIPEGMSKSRADILRYHTKSLMDGLEGRRKMDELTVRTFKLSKELDQQLCFKAGEIDVNVSILIRGCIQVGLPLIVNFPKLINFFEDSVIPK